MAEYLALNLAFSLSFLIFATAQSHNFVYILCYSLILMLCMTL